MSHNIILSIIWLSCLSLPPVPVGILSIATLYLVKIQSKVSLIIFLIGLILFGLYNSVAGVAWFCGVFVLVFLHKNTIRKKAVIILLILILFTVLIRISLSVYYFKKFSKSVNVNQEIANYYLNVSYYMNPDLKSTIYKYILNIYNQSNPNLNRFPLYVFSSGARSVYSLMQALIYEKNKNLNRPIIILRKTLEEKKCKEFLLKLLPVNLNFFPITFHELNQLKTEKNQQNKNNIQIINLKKNKTVKIPPGYFKSFNHKDYIFKKLHNICEVIADFKKKINFLHVFTYPITITPEKIYLLNISVKTERFFCNKNLYFEIMAGKNFKKYIARVKIPENSINKWQKLKLQFRVPEIYNTDKIIIRLRAYNSIFSGKILFKNISISGSTRL